MTRPSKDDYYLGIAKEVAKRSTCLRKRYGAVIVNRDQIISTGYAGAPRGAKNCLDIGHCPREKAGVPSGERYELCRSVHAEMNAIIHAARGEMAGGVIYLVGLAPDSDEYLTGAEPCRLCKRVIINAGLKYAFARDGAVDTKKFVVETWIADEEFDLGNARGY
jgi:dCMP deaminase